MGMNQCTKEAIWLGELMGNTGCLQEETTTIMCNNKGSMAFARNPTNHNR